MSSVENCPHVLFCPSNAPHPNDEAFILLKQIVFFSYNEDIGSNVMCTAHSDNVIKVFSN